MPRWRPGGGERAVENRVEYYFADGDVQRGPFSLTDLAGFGLRPDTLVWRDGLAEWRRADAVPEVYALLTQPAGGATMAGGPMSEARIDALPGTPTVALADEYPTAPAGGAYGTTGGGYGQPAYGTPAYTPAGYGAL